MGNNIDIVGLLGSSCGVLFVISIFIRIPKLEINIWSFLGRKIGNAINHDVMVKLDNLETKLDNHIQENTIKEVNLSRIRILRFNDELLHKEKHSREHFVEILTDIDDYEHYCDSIYEVNPDYYLDVLIETDKFQSYINEHGEWWINSSIVKENKD